MCPPLAPDDGLRAVLLGTATAPSEHFFAALLRHLADVLGMRHTLVAELVAELVGEGGACTRAAHGGAPLGEWQVSGTACEGLVDAEPRYQARGAREAFPRDPMLAELGAESHVAVALLAPDGTPLGYLRAFDPAATTIHERQLDVVRIFAARAAAELARLRVERTLGESEERFRDLFDEAPIAYVHEDLDSRFIRANRTALKILGVRPEEAVGTVGISLAPDTPDAQRRVREAFESIGRGIDTSGVVLELRRKDDGKPVWIQWWSRPDPSGTYTRTMFVDITDRVLMEREQARLTQQNQYLREEIKSVHNFEEIVGNSASLLRVLDNVKLVADTDATVLITGETGTGKELIARAIHSIGPRHEKPLIKVNCAALPAGLVESELFGHEKGAFSGAVARRTGRFELAHGGTIFLDELGELPLDVQVKLLRVLQEREFERVGSSTPIKVDVRVIAATNRDLRRAIADGTFRQDLYYRLNVFPLELPPLRERAEDIPLLAHYFVQRSVTHVGRRISRIPEEVMDRLRGYAWPGNIRELENIIERAVILSPGADLIVVPEMLPEETPLTVGERAPARRDGGAAAAGQGPTLVDVERAHIVEVLQRTRWRIEGPSGAASVLALHPNTLRSRIKKLGIRRTPEST